MSQLALPENVTVAKFSDELEGLVTDTIFAAGFAPPAWATKIKPVGYTNAPRSVPAAATFRTIEVLCGEFAALRAENCTWP